MSRNRYRLEKPTVGVHCQKGGKTRTTLPSGAVIELLSGMSEGARIVGVKWEGQIVMMLLQDFEKHASLEAS